MKKVIFVPLLITVGLLTACEPYYKAHQNGIDAPGEYHTKSKYTFEEVATGEYDSLVISFKLLKEKETGKYYLGVKGTNNEFGMTPLLNAKGEIVTEKNAVRGDLLFSGSRFLISKESFDIMDGISAEKIKDVTTGKEYFLISNKDGDGISLTNTP